MRIARLLLNPPARGSWNMAVDQMLLESAGRTGQIVLRFYQWQQPTLSLGYFQALKDRDQHHPSLGCPIVRRSTGGGAILHDHEITYSLCIPSIDRWSKAHERLYWVMHNAIIDALASWGIESATFQLPGAGAVPDKFGCGGSVSDSSTQDSSLGDGNKSFLCFQRRSPGDVIMKGHKICGSAQRRQQDSILQHGSVLFRRSLSAPELPGIDDLANVSPINRESFVSECCQRIGSLLDVHWSPWELGDEDRSLASKIEETFLSEDWLNKQRKQKA